MRAGENAIFDLHEIHFTHTLYQLHWTVIIENFDFDSQVNLLERNHLMMIEAEDEPMSEKMELPMEQGINDNNDDDEAAAATVHYCRRRRQ